MECWNEEYFRFKIPHSTKDDKGKFVDDYHQWECLKKLADQGYPTFYATNATLSKDALQKSTRRGTLLDETPLLDVRGVKALHKHVTFTEESEIFMLHSDTEESPKKSFRDLFDVLRQTKSTSLENSTKTIINSLSEMGNGNEEWRNDLSRITALPRIDPRSLQAWRKYVMLTSFVRKHIGSELLWLPDNR